MKANTYPNARKYIKGLDSCDDETKRMYEFEAQLCEAVKRTFGSQECPNCGNRVFKIGATIVDFTVSFVHSGRIRVTQVQPSMSAETTAYVQCENCGLKRPIVWKILSEIFPD